MIFITMFVDCNIHNIDLILNRAFILDVYMGYSQNGFTHIPVYVL